MPADQRLITPADLMPDAEFAKVRRERRAALIAVKRLRRVELGPVCTIHFECYETMLFQVQEMLLVEKGGAEQVPDELAAYNPLIPQGQELVATIMFEIDDPVRREATLARLGGVEDCFFVAVGAERVAGVPEGDIERTREDGKASSVHFVRFPLGADHAARFRDPATAIAVGCSHERYSHQAGLSPATRAELAKDFI
jgi:hypothetical protein